MLQPHFPMPVYLQNSLLVFVCWHVCVCCVVQDAHIPHDGRAYTTSTTESQDGNWAGCGNGCSELIPQSPM